MKETTKRILSLMLAFVMVVGLLPGLSVNVSAAEGVIDAAIFCSDVHNNPSTVTSVFNGIKSADSTFAPSTASFVGDTQCASSSVTSAAQSVFPGVGCYYAFGNHDDEGDYGISDVTGLIYGDSTTNYYIYAISENSMASSNPDTSGFTSTVAGLDKTKPLFIISHLPLHSRRGDSNGAAVWYPAISAAADEMDIFFFWAHNHTNESDVDIAAYYVAKGGDETITLEDTSTVVTPNFTYANAGYIDPTNTPARNNVATAVRIYEDSVNLTVYNASGELSGTYAVNETVAREFANTTDSGEDGSTEETTEPTEGETTEPGEDATVSDEGDSNSVTLGGASYEEKEVYVLVDSITTADDYVIVDTNTATTGANLLTASSNGVTNTSGATVAAGYDESGNAVVYIEDPAAAAIWTASSSSSGWRLYNSSLERYLRYSSSLTTTSKSNDATTWYSETNQLYRQGQNNDYWVRYSNGWGVGSANSEQTVYVYQKQTVKLSASSEVTYTMRASDLTKVVTADNLDGVLDFCLQGNGTDLTTLPSGGSYSFTVLNDENGIIDGEIASDGTFTFSGSYGEATVKVAYTWTQDGETYTVYRNVTVTASEPYYTLDITSGGNVVTGTTIAKKGVTNGQELLLGTQITFVSEDGTETLDSLPEGATIQWNIPEEYHSIATVGHDTGLVTFKGVDGAFYVTATLTVGGKDYTVGVNISATTSQYSTPTDGTDDFPEYPNEGAIRFDKTGTAVGNFSETGIAQIELSMTGVPYTTGSEIDVVVMLDMSTSMDDDRIAATVAATKVFVESIVKNTDGTYNGNRIYVGYFNGDSVYTITDSGNIGGELATVDNDTEYNALIAAIEDEYDGSKTASGTNYDVSLEKCYNVLTAAKTDGTGNDRAQFCVFMSDGGPTDYATSASNVVSESTVVDWFSVSASNSANWSNTMVEEYWSGLMKDNDVTIYSVGLILNEQPTSGPQDYRSYSAEQNYYVTSTILTGIASGEDYFINCESADDTDEMEGIFSNIAAQILQAATDITVEDKITDEYTMIFDIPEGTKDITGVTNDFYIEFGKYALDENHERTTFTSVTKLYLKNTNGTLSAAKDSTGTAYDAPTFEQKTIGDKGTLYYWSTNADDGDTGVSITVDETTYYFVSYGLEEAGYNMTSGAYANGTVDSTTNMSTDLVIATPYFVYNAGTKMIYWTVDKLDTYEYTLSYFLYLNNSATEVATDKETDPGSYPTNDHAYITYTNFNGNDCRQEFPIPQLTWSGAQVSYVFYLVNAAGQPINKSGQVVDFANATFVTDVYTENTVWNKGEDGKITADSQLGIEWLAEELLPDDYKVYDEDALYKLHVYGNHDGTSNFDYFIIDGGEAAAISSSLNERVEGANTTASTVSLTTTKVYNTKAGQKITGYGTYTSEETSSINNEIVLNNFDFYNTTVAFAVVWQPALVPDVVVVDYGLDVLINVVQNDILQNKVTGIGLGNSAYGDIAMNTGVSTTSKLGTAALTTEGNTISLENDTSVRFHQGDMEFNNKVVFYYETPVEFWEGSDPTEGYMYSSVTVIPATTIYYEDNFVTYESFTWNGGWQAVDKTSDKWVWSQDGTTSTATQAQDRPGASLISGSIDADNIYGYDGAYADMSTHSNGSAMKATVDYDNKGTASFTFWGTGFDVISLTSNATGSIYLEVYDQNNNLVVDRMVDTYYGYKQVAGDADHDGEIEEGEMIWVVDPAANDSIYQVPVIQANDLTYGKYTAKIIASYNAHYDHVEPSNANGSYDFYLDAIRIYDPANDGAGDQEIENAYKADHEGWPSYIELRDNLIAAETFADPDGDKTAEAVGMVFIDGDPAVGDGQLADYIAYGPNNEVYLAADQSVAFLVDAPANLDRIHIGIKSADGSDVSYTIKNVADDGTVTNQKTFTLNTSTDMYYDMTEWKDGIVVITNSGTSGILSITNIKSTYTSNPKASANGDVAAQSVDGERFETYIYMTSQAADAVINAMKPEPVNPFADVQKEHFFYEAVLWAVENGITNGVNADHFGPFMYCNRAQVVTFLWRATGSPEPTGTVNPFTDVKESDFFYKAVLWAVENGITNGLTATTFGPNALCNRAQVVTFLWRANGSKVVDGAANPFADVPADAFYHDAVVWAVKSGITTGASAAEFNPNGICMRAHVVTFLYRAEQLREHEVSGWTCES